MAASLAVSPEALYGYEARSLSQRGRLALPRLPLPVREFLEGGVEDEVTLRRNTEAFDDLALNPSTLVDVTEIDLSTPVLGKELSTPVIISPTGATGTFHPGAEIAVARAAAEAGTYYGLSANSTLSIEEVGAATAGPRMFQFYAFNDPGLGREMIDRARAAGFDALCLTVDGPVHGNRERDVRTGIAGGGRLSLRSSLSLLFHPRWLVNNARRRGAVPGNFVERAPDLPGPLLGALTVEKAARQVLGRFLAPSGHLGRCRRAGAPLERAVRHQGHHDRRRRARGRRNRRHRGDRL